MLNSTHAIAPRAIIAPSPAPCPDPIVIPHVLAQRNEKGKKKAVAFRGYRNASKQSPARQENPLHIISVASRGDIGFLRVSMKITVDWYKVSVVLERAVR